MGSASGAWQCAGIGNYYGDGTSGVLWRNTNTGEVDIWQISNGQYAGGHSLGALSNTWQIQPNLSA